MKKLLLLIVVLGIAAFAVAQEWETVRETAMEYGPFDGPNDAFFIDANTGWLVNDAGRVQKTTDGGSTWTTVREPVDGAEDWVKVEFADANVGYATAGEGEIYKTTDGGNNWTMIGDTANYISDIEGLSVVSADVVYFCGDDSLLLKTTDGGVNFARSDFSFDGEDLDGGIAFCTEDVGVVMSSANGGHSWYTDDGGDTWNYVSIATYYPPGTASTRLYDIEATGESTIVITGYHYVTLVSNDGGKTYDRVGGLSYGYDRNEIVDMIDENTFFIAGDYLARTTDGGATFDTLWTGSGQGFEVVEFIDENTGYVIQNYGFWKKTTDGGETWENYFDWPSVSFWGIGFPTDDKIILAGWGGGEMSVSEDGGNTFTFPDNYLSGTSDNLYECEFFDENTGFIGGSSGFLAKSDDGGDSFTQLENPMFLNTNKHINAIHIYNQNTLFVGGSSGYLMRSTDAGQTFTDTKVNSGVVYDIYAIDENTVIATESSGKVCYGVFDESGAIVTDSLIIDVGYNAMRSVDVRNDVVLIAASKGVIYRADVNDLAGITDVFTEADGDDFYDVEFVTDDLVYAVGKMGKIYKSEDAGLNWTQETSPTEETLQKIKLGNERLWAVGQRGIVVSLNLSTEPELMTIADAKADTDEDGTMDNIDTEIKIQGIVTSPNYGYNTQYYMQDATAGIVLYSGDVGVDLNIGDEVEVTGTLTEYNGLSEVDITAADDVTVLSTGNSVEPVEISLADLGEAYEAMLVTVDSVMITDVSQWPAEGDNGSVDITDGENTSYIYIDKESELDGWTPPSNWMTLTALVDQYNDYSLRGTVAEHFVEYPTAIDEDQLGLPKEFALHQNYPNPFNPTTQIVFDVPKAADIKLSLYNLQGKKVAEIANETMKPGYYNITFDASHLPSGLYFYKIRANDFVAIKKMTLLK
ncbi:MAG: YCF48-related protein [Fidelibacterota bacterium]